MDRLIWNLRLGGKTSIQHILKAHYRAITDINWHTTECDVVCSIGVDSWIWAWDIRTARKPIFGAIFFPLSTQNSIFFRAFLFQRWSTQNPSLLYSKVINSRWNSSEMELQRWKPSSIFTRRWGIHLGQTRTSVEYNLLSYHLTRTPLERFSACCSDSGPCLENLRHWLVSFSSRWDSHMLSRQDHQDMGYQLTWHRP